jgi:hypothetical protein
MAIRDAVKSIRGASAFAAGLYDLFYGSKGDQERFTDWCSVVGALPRRQTRVLTWPLVTVFAFIAQPENHIFLKPNVTRAAAKDYGFSFEYSPTPAWTIYENLLAFADVIRRDLADLQPKDMMDIQSFIWVQGSSEYDE